MPARGSFHKRKEQWQCCCCNVQVFEYVRDTPPTADIAGDSSSIALWEAQAVLMLWLSILVLMPFDLFILDSTVTSDANPQQAKRGYTPLAAKIMDLCQEYLKHPGESRRKNTGERPNIRIPCMYVSVYRRGIYKVNILVVELKALLTGTRTAESRDYTRHRFE